MVSDRWVLLVDDDEDFRQLFAAALKESRLAVRLFELADGFSALNYLLGNGPYAERSKFPLPDVAFIDLAMPGMDGLALVKDIRTRLGLQDLPIIVLTNSNLRGDVAAAYSSLASAYHRKPARYIDLVDLLRTIVPLWLNFRGDTGKLDAPIPK